jgi:hypothetical protein
MFNLRVRNFSYFLTITATKWKGTWFSFFCGVRRKLGYCTAKKIRCTYCSVKTYDPDITVA